MCKVDVLLAVTLLLSWGATDLAAQQPDSIRWPEPGVRVRIVAPNVAADTLHGHVWELRDDALLLQMRMRHRERVPYADVLELDTAIYGRDQKTVIYSMAAGAVFLNVLGLTAPAETSVGGKIAILTLVGAGVGAAIGSIGATRNVVGWEEFYRRPGR